MSRSEKARRLVVWLVFGVLCGGLPIYIDFLRRPKATEFWWGLGNGDLMILLASAAAAAFGEIYIAKHIALLFKVVIGIPLLLLFAVCIVTFTLAQVPLDPQDQMYVTPHLVYLLSLWFTGVTIFFGSFAVILTAGEAAET